MKDELIIKVANLISEGKGDALEAAIRQVTGEVPANDTPVPMAEDPVATNTRGDTEDGENWDDWNEDDDVNVRHDISDCINGLNPMTSVVPNAILVVPMPTIYGIALLVDMSKYDYSVGRVESLFKGEYSVLPVEIETMTYDNGMVNEMFVYRPDLEDEAVDYALIVPKQDVNRDVGYIFPINGSYAGMGGVASDPVDMVNAVRTLYNTIDNPITLPVIGYKVTKPDGSCKGMTYEVYHLYTTDEEVVMHRNGFHFTTNPRLLKTWYKGPYMNNRPWIVQAGPYVDWNDRGVAVSDGLIFVKELGWDDIP